MNEDERPLVVIGAAGAVGGGCVTEALRRGWPVRAIELDWNVKDHPPEGVERIEADAMDGDLAPHFDGARGVISALGVRLSLENAVDPPPLYTEGTRHIVGEMRKAELKRLVLISASFVETRRRGPVWFQASAAVALDAIFDQMEEMETILKEMDDIDWTAVRPGWLMDGEKTEDYTVTERVIPEDLIRTRCADLAHFMVACIAENSWIHGMPAIARPESDEASSVGQLLSELTG